MSEAEQIICLEREKLKLQEDKEILMNIISQMKVTLNRLIDRCISEQSP